MLHPHRNMRTNGKTDRITGTIPFHHAPVGPGQAEHIVEYLTMILEEISLIMR